MGGAGWTQGAHLAEGCLSPEAQDRAWAPSGEGQEKLDGGGGRRGARPRVSRVPV